MKKKKIITVVGTRPNFVKAAPIHHAFNRADDVMHYICHTGQHFDQAMSSVFFDELGLPEPDFHLGIAGGSQSEQLGGMMQAFEVVLQKVKPELVIVLGDVNSTLAGAIMASRYEIPLAHVEAGLRSHDRSMPEEVNRVLTDHLANYHFTTEKIARDNLVKEGIDPENIFFTGNVMIDSLIRLMPEIDKSLVHRQLEIEPGEYILSTFHRPANVEDASFMSELLNAFRGLSEKKKIVFPLHPRTRKSLEHFNLLEEFKNCCIITGPAGYVDFLALTKEAAMVITDSGGIQEETTFLKVPCITVRDNTERPVTQDVGTNFLAGRNFEEVLSYSAKILNGEGKKGQIPEKWDGKAAERIVQRLIEKI